MNATHNLSSQQKDNENLAALRQVALGALLNEILDGMT